ncbi:DUF6503 family protein [Flagellimonas flava]|uniref:Deoxyribose-phosphate aldolase n=1 Tax=Flagellimonas flava TaxID=570519 RepID=A0A1M5IAC1_9FLAO|nr:DUF6503 family protein [Allomuricauda flava]SHG25175.1 hypothetical protein SAMN04488116_0565 [Allomuricauda flava]
MPRIIFALCLFAVLSCKNTTKPEISAQDIVDKSIEVSGGQLHKDHDSSFLFRNRKYIATRENGKKVLKRITYLDSVVITDVRAHDGLARYINDSLVSLSDSLANRYANAVNSVHYFARLPFGLNDKAVNKTYLGEEIIKGENYYKIKVTFDQQGGGDDFDDTYVYWFHAITFKPDYLAYDFHVNGGGQRFRVAYNERYIDGIRFVDYENYKSKDKETDILSIGTLYEQGGLELLSKIELSEITVE